MLYEGLLFSDLAHGWMVINALSMGVVLQKHIV